MNLDIFRQYYNELAEIVCNPDADTQRIREIHSKYRELFKNDKKLLELIDIEHDFLQSFPLTHIIPFKQYYFTPAKCKTVQNYLEKRLGMDLCPPYRAVLLTAKFLLLDDYGAGNSSIHIMYDYWKGLLEKPESEKRIFELYRWIIETCDRLKSRKIILEIAKLAIPLLENWCAAGKYGNLFKILLYYFPYVYNLPETEALRVLDVTRRYFENISSTGHINQALRLIDEGKFLEFIFRQDLDLQKKKQIKTEFIPTCFTLKKRYAESDELRADGALKAHFLNEAMKFAYDYGLGAQTYHELKQKCYEAMKDYEYPVIGAEIQIPAHVVETVLKQISEDAKQLYPEDEIPEIPYFGKYYKSLPTLQTAIQAIQAEGPTIDSLFTTRTHPQGLLYSSKEPDTNSNLEYRARNRIYLQLTDPLLYFEIIIDRLIETGALSSERLFGKIEQISEAPVEELVFLREGLDHHFKGEYVASMHIIIPQIERLAKGVVYLKHKPTPSTKKVAENYISQQLPTFGPILSDEGTECLGSALQEALRIMLYDPEFQNWRHKLCHGWAKHALCTKYNSTTIIWILLMVLYRRSEILKGEK
jgi:hypothetical protein